METPKEIQTLTAFLNKRGKTLSWAAKGMDVSYPHLHHVVKGRRPLAEGMKNKIIYFLDTVTTPQVG